MGALGTFHARTFRTAFRALRRNKMRSALTTLGIVIGVGAVIAMMEIGNGSSSAIQRSISSMGVANLLVSPGAAASGGVNFGGGSAQTLTPEDGEAVIRECPAVQSVAVQVHARAQLVFGNRNWVPMSIDGSDPNYFAVKNWPVSEGEPFTEQDVRNASKVCVIGQTLVREMFEGNSPVGREIRVKNVSFRVVGVLERKGASMMGMDQDDILVAPWTTIKRRISGSMMATVSQSSSSADAGVNSLSDLYPGRASLYPLPSVTQAADTPLPVRFSNVDHLMVAARSTAEVPEALRQITAVLHERHRIHEGQADDFNVRDMAEIVKTLTSTTNVMMRLLLCVAMISLVVGGVGIMNIMLVSVTERTREIGLRMAVGARGRDILRQFLVEAVVLCMLGGSIGILSGRGTSLLLRTLLRWPTELSMGAIFWAVGVSITVGVVFGYYPAMKASRLDPIEALRYE
jgi:ABC-type antimicrobial peptide transport system permease subunit